MDRIAVIPAYNEAGTIGRTVKALAGLGMFESIYVVDDGSTDSTSVEASAAGARVVVNGRNLGKGASLNRLLSHLEFDELLLIDADLGDSASLAGSLVLELASGSCDIAVAAFPPAERKGGFGLAQGTGRLAIKLLTGREMKSPISGQRAIKREAFEQVFPFEEGFGMEVGMTLDALRAGLFLKEVPAWMSHRETGRDIAGFAHRGRQLKDIIGASLRRLGRAK